MNRYTLTALVLTTATSLVPAVAHADAARDLSQTFGEYVQHIDVLERGKKYINKNLTVEACRAAVASAKQAGVAPSAKIGGMSFKRVPGATKDDELYFAIPFSKAGAFCDFYAVHYSTWEAAMVLNDSLYMVEWAATIDKAFNHEENGKKLLDQAARCASTIDRVIAAGVPPTTSMTVDAMGTQRTVTIGDAKASVCKQLDEVAKPFAAEVEKAKKARYEKIAAPLKKAGISGEKLEMLVHLDGLSLFGKKMVPLDSPKKLAKAPLIFDLLLDTDRRIYTLRRYEFKGMKLVATTERQFQFDEPGPREYR